MFKRLRTIPKPVELLNLLTGSAVYIILLVIPPPPFISQALNQSGWMILLLLVGIFTLLLHQKGNGWDAIQSAFVFALFALLLIHQWQFAPNYGEIIGGLLPWTDAAGYLLEAQRVLNGSLLTAFGARRPLFPAFLAVLLQLTGRNFMVSLAVLTWVNALAVLLVVQEVKRSYGALGASVLLISAYKFYLRFAGTTMTEQLGFALGSLAVFFLLIGARTKSLKHALSGLGLLCLALNARAGAFFILPILILWLVMTFYPQAGLWRTLGLSVIVVTLPFVFNFLLFKAIADPRSTPFSNYSYTLYGLASGNKGWTQAGTDYPNDSESEIMSLAIQKIRSDPALFLRGILGSYRDYFTPLGGAFTFIVYSLYSFRAKATVILWFLTLTGITFAALNWRKGSHALILASFIGVFASLTLVPPIDSDGMRIYAATIPFTALWVVEGGYALFSWGKKLLKQREDMSIKEIRMPVERLATGFSVVLIVLAIPGPILLQFVARSSNGSAPPAAQTACEPGAQLLQGSLFRNTSIRLIPDSAATESYMPFIRLSDFQSGLLNGFSDTPFLGQELQSLQAGQQISLVFDVKYNKVWVISSYPLGAGGISACATPTENQQLRPYNFYYLNGPPVSPSSLTISQQTPGITLLFRLLYGLAAGILTYLVVMELYRPRRKSLLENLYLIGVAILILQAVLVGLYSQAIITLPFAEKRTTLQVKDAVPKKPTHLYILSLGIDWMSQADLGASPAVVYENGIPLAAPNALHDAIKDSGDGGYSIWDGNLFFSSSDNTDPRTNGRKYELEWPRPIRPLLVDVAYLGGALGLVLLIFRELMLRTAGTWLNKKSKTDQPTP
jgi:hypothetical protein